MWDVPKWLYGICALALAVFGAMGIFTTTVDRPAWVSWALYSLIGLVGVLVILFRPKAGDDQ